MLSLYSRPKIPKIALGLSVCLGALAFSSMAFAQVVPDPTQQTDSDSNASGTQALPQVIVTAPARLPEPVSEVANSITVVTAADIQALQERTLPGALEDVPGLNVVQTGGPGGATQVFIRGTDSNQTKVFLDGIDISDPSTADASFDFSTLLTSDISQIEVLRGPQSGLYGSDAIGGVVNIVTKTGSGPPHLYGSLEGGSFGTFNQTVGVGGSTSRVSYALDFAHFSSTDNYVTPPNLVPPGRPLNPDSYDNRSLSAKVGVQVSDNFDVGLVGHYIESTLFSTSDDFIGPESIQSRSGNKALFSRAFGHLVLFDGRFDQTLALNYTDYHRSFDDPNPASDFLDFYNGDRVKVDYQGNIYVVPGETVTIGAEHERDAISDTPPFAAGVSNDAGFMQLQSNVGGRFFNLANLRDDQNEQFGGALTFREAPAILFPETGTKLKGSIGSGFKAPSLEDLYQNFPPFFFANPNLQPEKSLGYDVGFEQSLFGERASFGATYFHNDIRNLIQGVVNAEFVETLENVGRATTQGVESFVAIHPWAPLTLRADYTFTHAENDITQQGLLRIPDSKFSLTGIWQVTERAKLSGQLVYESSWLDNNRDFTNLEPLVAPGYVLVNLAGTYDLGQGITAFARIDNLLNEHYQVPLGFDHPGIGVFGGVRVAFDVPVSSPPASPLVTK